MISPKSPRSRKPAQLVSRLKAWTENEKEYASVLKWWGEHDKEIEDFVTAPDTSKTILYIMSRYLSDTIRAIQFKESRETLRALQKTVELTKSQHRELDSERAYKNTLARALFEDSKQRSEVLALGRKRGVTARKAVAEKNRATLERSVAELFDKPDKPGWAWTTAETVKFLAPQFHGIYTPGTIKQAVKRDAAKFRKARKQQLASKFSKR